jgi:hypothetical protein
MLRIINIETLWQRSRVEKFKGKDHQILLEVKQGTGEQRVLTMHGSLSRRLEILFLEIPGLSLRRIILCLEKEYIKLKCQRPRKIY